MSTTTVHRPRPPRIRGAARYRLPGLAVVASTVTLIILCPLVFVVMQASHAGWGDTRRLLFRPLMATLIWHTVALAVVVTVVTVAVGFLAAWCVERTDLPAKRFWIIALTMPLAVPEFVHGYCWVSLFPSVHGFWGAVLVESSLYPFVFLPALAVLRRGDGTAEDVARSLGHGQASTLWRVTLPLTRPALAGGALLVALYLLGEYGAFAMVRFTTFATAIYTEFSTAFDTAAAGTLTLVLVIVAAVIVVAEGMVGGRGRIVGVNVTGRRCPPVRLGRARGPVIAALVAVLTVALGVPLYALGYWLMRGSSTTLPSASIWSQTVTTVGYAIAAAVTATLAAIPVALYAWRRNTAWARGVERAAYLTRALPGIAVALALVYFGIRFAQPLYQQPPLLVAGYVVLFFPLALTGVRASLAQIPPGVEEVARSLGARWWSVLGRVVVPLIAPGLGAAFAMVALTATTELTATLLLQPTGTQTLATQFWVYTTGLAWGAAAPYAAVMTALSIPAVWMVAARTLRPAPTGGH